MLWWVYFYSEFDGILLDYSRQRIYQDTMEKLFRLAEVKFLLFFFMVHIDGVL